MGMSGIDIDAVHSRQPGLGRPARPVRDSIADKVGKPEGMSRSDLLYRFKWGPRRDEADRELQAMIGDGTVIRATRRAASGGQSAVRYFLHAADAQRWQSEVDGRLAPRRKPQKLPKPPKAAKKLLSVHEQTVGMAWRKLPPAALAQATVITPAGVKRTVGPSVSYDPRYQVDPSKRVPGGFAAMGPGRYLDGAGT